MSIQKYYSQCKFIALVVIVSFILQTAYAAPPTQNVPNSSETAEITDEDASGALSENGASADMTSPEKIGNSNLYDSTRDKNVNDTFPFPKAETRERGLAFGNFIRAIFANWVTFVIFVAVFCVLITACCHYDFFVEYYLNTFPEKEKSGIFDGTISHESQPAAVQSEVPLEMDDVEETDKMVVSKDTRGNDLTSSCGKVETEI